MTHLIRIEVARRLFEWAAWRAAARCRDLAKCSVRTIEARNRYNPLHAQGRI